MKKFRKEFPYPAISPKEYQCGFNRYPDKNKPTWAQVPIHVCFIAPYGAKIEEAYLAWLGFEIAICEGKKVKGGIKHKREIWNKIKKIKTLVDYNKCFLGEK